MIIFPLIIAPIFNKFSPIENGLLKERLEKLLTRCKFKSKGLFTMVRVDVALMGMLILLELGSKKNSPV